MSARDDLENQFGAFDREQLIAEVVRLGQRVRNLEEGDHPTTEEYLNRTNIEQAVRAGESRLEEAERTAQIGNWEYDLATEELIWSAEIYRIFGTSPAEFIPSAESYNKFVHPEDRERIRDLIEQGQLTGKQFSFEHRIVLPDGEIRWVHQENLSTKESEGGAGKRRGTVQHITQRKLSEEALRNSEAQYRLLVDNMPALIAYVDSEMRYRSVNLAFEEWFQVPSSSVLGKTVEEVAGAENFAKVREYVERALAGEQVNYERTLHYPGGRAREIHAILVPDFGPENMVRGYFALVTDITERKATEEALRAGEELLRGIFETEAVGIATTTPEGRYIQSNSAYLAMIGRDSEELTNMTFFELTHEDDQAEAKKKHTELLAGVIDSYQLDKRYIHKDGSVVWVNVNTSRLKDAEGNMIGDIAVVENITHRREIEAQLLQSQKMEAVGQLTGGVAHDFNNLLTIISGCLQMLEDSDGVSNSEDDLLRRALQAVQRGADLTQRLLAFSRRQTLRPHAVDAGRLVVDMIGILERTLGASVEIITSQPDDLWPCEADPSQLENAILNLAINARDAMPNGGTLSIEIENAELIDEEAAVQAGVTSGSYVVLTVSDNGVGIPRESLERVFEPFYTTKGAGKGSGLGLSMVYGFAQQSGGYASIESETDHGTAVRIYLPRSRREVKPAPDVATSPFVKSSVPVPEASGETILVVEDDTDVRKLSVTILSKLGYAIIEAPDAKTALKLLQDIGEGDLLLSDIVLPGKMNGVELAVEMCALQPRIKVVFMSGYTQRAFDAEEVAGLDYVYIQKPFGKTVLARAIRDALDS